MGFLLLMKREYKTSVKHFLQSLDHETANVKADIGILHNIGIIYYNLGKPWQALMYFAQAKMKYDLGRAHVASAQINNAIAMCYTSVGEFDKAEHIYNDALAQAKRVDNDLETGIALNNLAALYLKKGNIDECLKVCNQAAVLLKNDFRYIHALVNKAVCLIEMKDFAQCKEIIKKGKELVKDDKTLTIFFEFISHLSTLDNKDSTDYLENIAIPHCRATVVDEGGGIYRALDICQRLEAHYRKKRNKRKADAIGLIGRDIAMEIFFGGVGFE